MRRRWDRQEKEEEGRRKEVVGNEWEGCVVIRGWNRHAELR